MQKSLQSDYENFILEYTQEGNMGHDTLQF